MKPLRPLVVLTLVVAFPLVLLVGFVALTGWGLATETSWAAGLGAGLSVLFGVAVVGGLRAPRPAPEGVPLTRQAQPELWREVDDLADRLGAVRPATLHVLAAPDATTLGTAQGWDLGLGYPLIVRLTAGELRAVLAHAIAFRRAARGPGVAALLAADERLRAIYDHVRPPVSWLLWPLRWVHTAAMGFVERSMGDDADRLAASVTTPATAASALRRTTELEAAWSVVLEEYVSLFASYGRRASVAEALERLEEAAAGDLTRAADEALRTDRPGWLDAATVTADRISALGELPDPGLSPDTRPALALWTGGHEALLAVEEALGVEPLPVVGWAELVRDGLPVATRQGMAAVAATIVLPGASPDAPPATYAQLFAELALPDGGEVGELLSATSDEPGDEDPAGFLRSLVACGLFETGAEARLRWDAPADVIDHDGRPIDLPALTADAVGSPPRVRALTDLLERRGLDLGRSPGDDVQPPLPEVLAVATLLQVDGHGRRDGIFWTTGLLLVPAAGPTGVEPLLRRPLAELQAAPDHVWLPAESIRRWQVRLLPRFAIHLDTHDGPLELRPTDASRGEAEIPEALAVMVGPPTRRRDWEAS